MEISRANLFWAITFDKDNLSGIILSSILINWATSYEQREKVNLADLQYCLELILFRNDTAAMIKDSKILRSKKRGKVLKI